MDQIVLEMDREELARWRGSRATKKVFQFLRKRQSQVMQDWAEGNYPQTSLEEVGIWTLTLSAKSQAYEELLNLEQYLTPEEEE